MKQYINLKSSIPMVRLNDKKDAGFLTPYTPPVSGEAPLIYQTELVLYFNYLIGIER
jgi:hypothetical protein